MSARSRPNDVQVTTAVDVPCTQCGREPSHPQVRNRFVYAAYHRAESSYSAAPRCYIAALCEPCVEADLRASVGTARNRFLNRVRRWSGLAINRERIVRLLQYPEGIITDERETDDCFVNGAICSFSALSATKE